MLALRDHALDVAVEPLVLEEAHGVRITDGSGQQALCVVGERRRDHLQARCLEEPGLGVLRVERPAGEAAARGQPDDHRHGDALAVVQLCGDVHKLVEAAGDEVGELHLADRLQSLGRGADGGADDRVLGKRGVDHAGAAELLDEPVGDLEGPAERTDVLAEADHRVVAAHLLTQRRRRWPRGRSSRGFRPRRLQASSCRRSALPPPSATTAPCRRRAAPSRRRRRPSVAVAGSGIGESSACLAQSST